MLPGTGQQHRSTAQFFTYAVRYVRWLNTPAVLPSFYEALRVQRVRRASARFDDTTPVR